MIPRNMKYKSVRAGDYQGLQQEVAGVGGRTERIKTKSRSLQQLCQGEAGQGGRWGQHHSD